MIYNNHSSNYGDVLKIVTDRPKTAAIAVWNGPSSKSFWVYGDGEVYSRGQLILSDARLKKNVENINSPLSKVLSLRGVIFDREDKNSESIHSNDTLAISPQIRAQMNSEKERKHIGVIAQEVERVIPEAVRTTQDGTKAVTYSELIGLLIEAIKEQQTQIEELRLAIETISSIDSQLSTQ